MNYFDFIRSTPTQLRSENSVAAKLRSKHDLHLMLIGPAGCGKTTLTKRIASRCIGNNQLVIPISFHNIGKNVRMSLKYFLSGYVFITHHVSVSPDEDIETSFQWLLHNQENVVIIFDGLDQARFDIANQPPNDATMDDKLLPEVLISLILSRKVLPDTRVIITSRPHSIVNFSTHIQPDEVIYVNDLKRTGMVELMNFYIGEDNVDEILKRLEMKSSRIFQLIHNPLFLRLFAMLHDQVADNIWSYLTTTSSMFKELIERLQSSANFNSECCGEKLIKKMAEVAYQCTMQGSVIVTNEDLKGKELSANDVQDLMFGVKGQCSGAEARSLVGMMKFFFHHQSIQVS